jgi:hypothetical protein
VPAILLCVAFRFINASANVEANPTHSALVLVGMMIQ